MEYKFKNIHLNVDNVEDIQMPELKDRIIEKRGDIIEFSFSELENNIEKLKKLKVEIEAKIKHEEAVCENIKHFHSNITEMSEEDLLTAWMYKNSKGEIDIYSDKLKKVEDSLAQDSKEMEDILEQLPDLKTTE